MKFIWIIALVDSVDVYKTISTTHITIIEILIMLRGKVDFHKNITTTHINHFQISINDQWRQRIIISTTYS